MTSLAWVKLHADILGDPKLMRAARKGAKHLELLPWLIVFAARAGDDGRLTVNGEPAEPVDIAAQIPGAKASAVQRCIAALEEIGVLEDDDGAPRFVAWQKRALGKPSDAPEAVRERQRRLRERRKAARVGDDDETPDTDEPQRVRHALPGALRHATEKEREGEKEEIKSSTTADAREARSAELAQRGGRVYEALNLDDRSLWDRLLAASAGDARGFVGLCQRALDGMTGKALTPAQLADVVDQYLGNLASGAEQGVNRGRFQAYLERAIQRAHAPPSEPRHGPRTNGRRSPGQEAYENALAAAEGDE